MITSPVACVVDASVGIKLVITEVLSNEAHALFAHLARDPAARFFVPDLFDIECGIFCGSTSSVRGIRQRTLN